MPPAAVAPGSVGTPSKGDWYELNSTAPFYASTAYAMADDPAEGGVVLVYSSQTWVLAHGSWGRLVTVGTPPASWGMGLAYDASDGYLVMFGGVSSTFQVENYTWVLETGTWKNITLWSAQRPPARYWGSMAYDSAMARIVLFGGTNNSVSSVINDTWSFHAGNWTKLNASASPQPRYEAAMADDPALGGTLLFGGLSYSPTGAATIFNDTWLLSHGGWTNLTPALSPPPRHGGVLAYDALDRADLLFGGSIGSSVSNGTWTFRNGSWVRLNPTVTPPSRGPAAGAYDPTTGEFVVYGGTDAQGSPLYDTWAFGSGFVLLDPKPVGDGALSFNGTTYSTASVVELGYGNYSVSQHPFPWARYSNWTATGNLSFHLFPLTNLSGELTVLGNGTLAVNYAAYPGVLVLTDPSACGPVTVQGGNVSSGTTLHLPPGTYALRAGSCGPSLEFLRWNVFGNVSVPTPEAANVSLVVTGNGSVQAVYGAPVTLVVQPAAFGGVEVDGVRYPNGSVANLSVGNHTLAGAAQPWSALTGFEVVQGDLVVRGGTLGVGGPGGPLGRELLARFELVPQVTVEVTPGVCGPLEVANGTRASGSTLAIPPGTAVNVTASNCTAKFELFHAWRTSGGVSVTDATRASTTVTAESNGSLEARFVAGWPVAWSVTPSGAGTILLNGSLRESNGTVSLLGGWEYAVGWSPGSGYGNGSGFAVTWVATGSVTVRNGTLRVAGSGAVDLVVSPGPAPGPGGGGSTEGVSLGAYLAIGVVAACGGGLGVLGYRRRRRRRSP